MPKVTRSERSRRDGVLIDLGRGDSETGRNVFRDLAREHDCECVLVPVTD